MMYRCLCFVVFAVMLISCSDNRNGQEGKLINVDLSIIEEVNLFDNSLQSIALENIEAGMIGDVKKIFILDSIIYIHNLQKISMFGLEGRFLGNISNQGRANNEYLTLWYCWNLGNNLYIYDMNGKKILKYDTDDRSVSTITLPDDITPFQALIPFADSGFVGKMMYTGGSEEHSPELGFYDSDFQFIETIGDLDLTSGLWLGDPFSSLGDGIIYWRQMENYIFSIDRTLAVKVKYKIDFGSKNVPNNDFADDYDKIDFMNRSSEKYAGFINNVVETERNVMFGFLFDSKRYYCIYDKDNHTSTVYSFQGRNNEMINTIINLGDYTLVVSNSKGGNGIIYFIETEKIR